MIELRWTKLAHGYFDPQPQSLSPKLINSFMQRKFAGEADWPVAWRHCNNISCFILTTNQLGIPA